MKKPLALIGISFFCLAAAPIAKELVFRPEAGSTVSKVFETSLELGLDDLLVNFNGQEMDPALMGMDMDQANMSVVATVELQDEYGETKDGRPLRLTRQFETINANVEFGDGESETANDSDLEGATITFEWNAKNGSYDLSSEDEGLNLDKISHAGEDTDLRSLLPEGEVEIGDEWQLKGPAVLSVLWPGVDLAKAKQALASQMDGESIPFPIDEVIGELLETSVLQCTYTGSREDDGNTYQVIELASEVEQQMEMGEILLEFIRTNSPSEADMDLTADVEIAAMLQGELLWDSAAGHFRQCDMEIELALLGTFDVSAEVQGNSVMGSAEVEASGIIRRKAYAR